MNAHRSFRYNRGAGNSLNILHWEKWLYKLWFPHNGTLLSNDKKQTLDTDNSLDEAQGPYKTHDLKSLTSPSPSLSSKWKFSIWYSIAYISTEAKRQKSQTNGIMPIQNENFH